MTCSDRPGPPGPRDSVRVEAGFYTLRFPLFEKIPSLYHRIVGKAPDNENRAIAGALSFPGGPCRAMPLFLIRQVHGANVLTVLAETALHEGTPPEGDGAVTALSGILLRVVVADCVPILFVDPVKRMIGIVHAGWRGMADGVIEKGVDRLCRIGADPDNILAAAGPAIGPCCYEVGEEVLRRLGPTAIPARTARGTGSVDLPGTARRRLAAAGIGAGRTEISTICTSCDSSRFHSHRRSGGAPGRNLALLALRDFPE